MRQKTQVSRFTAWLFLFFASCKSKSRMFAAGEKEQGTRNL